MQPHRGLARKLPLAVRTSKSAVCELLRVAWRTVGSIVARVGGDVDKTVDRLAGLMLSATLVEDHGAL